MTPLAGLLGCGGPLSASGPLTYSRTAQKNYDAGMAGLRSRSCEDAVSYFNHVRRNFAYTRYARLSELRLADCAYVQEKYVEAVSQYRDFVRFHPTDAEAQYAAFRIGLSYYRMIPGSFFLLPPSHELDLAPVHDALRELRNYRRDHSRGPNQRWTGTLIRDCLALLARHEMYVAQFYLDRDEPEAAISRLSVVFRDYGGSGLEPEAMYQLGEVFLSMRRDLDARTTFEDLTARYPNSPHTARARRYLQMLRERAPRQSGRPGAAG